MSHSIDELTARWERLARRSRFPLEHVPCPGTERRLLCGELGDASKPRVHISAGVHGDEPAGPWALLSLAEDGLLDRRFSFRIWPCTNPSGYRAGTRVNAEGNDVNRSFSEERATPESRAIMARNRGERFALAFDLHEDFEADGFYCYEPVVDGDAPLSSDVLCDVEAAGFPLQTLDHLFDLGYPKDESKAARFRTLERGRVLVNTAAETRLFPGLPLSLYLLRSATRRYLTVETPRRRAWEDRIAMHRIAVVAALTKANALLAH